MHRIERASPRGGEAEGRRGLARSETFGFANGKVRGGTHEHGDQGSRYRRHRARLELSGAGTRPRTDRARAHALLSDHRRIGPAPRGHRIPEHRDHGTPRHARDPDPRAGAGQRPRPARGEDGRHPLHPAHPSPHRSRGQGRPLPEHDHRRGQPPGARVRGIRSSWAPSIRRRTSST